VTAPSSITSSVAAAPAERALLWPVARRDEVAHALARSAGITRPAVPDWFQLSYEDVAAAALTARLPGFFLVEGGPDGDAGLLAVVAHTGTGVRVLAPDGAPAHLPAPTFARLLRAAAEARFSSDVDVVVARAGVATARSAAVRDALVGAALAGEPAVEGWRVRSRTGSLAAALREAGIARRLALTSLAYGAQLALLVVAWWMVGARAAAGQPGTAGVAAWVGVLAAFVAAHAASSWAAGRLAVDAGRLLRSRLMEGLLALDTEPLRAEGIGQLLGRVLETEAVESLALGGGLLGVAGIFELTTGAVILALGARASSELAFLALTLTVGAVLATRLWRALGRWSGLRLGLTHDLVERMVGHRTLVAQQPAELRHGGEDEALSLYESAGQTLDRAVAALAVLVPRGWLLLGVATLAPALAASSGVGAGLVATTLGGVLFVHGALRKLSQAFPPLATAAVAWRQVAPLFAGASDAERARAHAASALPRVAGPSSVAGAGSPGLALVAPPALVVARDVGFRYPARPAPALAGCSFEIRRGDRVLLEGPSGGGKSTLASLVAGLRAPDAGTLALDGVDQADLGLAGWRERVGVVPQFHENHVFTSSVLFNLLLGRGWPPRREDVVLAESLCRELELGGVLARMPSGLEQLVGESGWQLSHGERSRLFIARALLQRLDLRVLDESFAALDPETLERVLDCVLARAETLLVIAHP
jgi:ATP-binding cassette subfamily B protein